MPTPTITLTELTIYPVKSCRGIAVPQAVLGARGLEYDRLWMIVQPDGTFITQRQAPRLALIAPSLQDGHLALAAPAMPPIQVPVAGDGPAIDVVVWRDRCAAIDQGAEIAAWLTEFLHTPCRLVRMADDWVRPVDPAYSRPGDQVGFADGYPLLLTSEASLADLNARLPEPVPMNRFRPNLVIHGTGPFAEDAWHMIRIGDVPLRLAKPCARCVTTTVVQETGVCASQEPLATLAGYRQRNGGALFGQNLIHDAPGMLRVGDQVEVLA